MLAASNTLRAADNGIYNVKVTIIEASGVAISIIGDTLNFGYVVQGSSVISAQGGRTIVKNLGGVNCTYKMRITSKPAEWTVGTASLSDTGADKFVLATVFAVWDGTPQWSWFQDNDVLTESDKTATAEPGGIFISDTPDSPASNDPNGSNWDGFNVGTGGEMSNFYLFNAPTTVSSWLYGNELTIQATVTAVQQ